MGLLAGQQKLCYHCFTEFNKERKMYRFSIFVFGRLSHHKELVSFTKMQELVAWAIDMGFSYCVEAVE